MKSLLTRTPAATTGRRTTFKNAWVRTVGRFDALSACGGGEVQQRATEDALRHLGVDARPWRPWEDRLRKGDILHFFGSRPEFLPLVEAAKQQGARVVVSTIAWFDWRNAWREHHSLGRRALNSVRYAVRAALPQIASWRRRLYAAADMLLPNSQAEAEQLMRLFGMPASKIRVVPNGFDARYADATPHLFQARYGLRDFVLTCGRIEPRKNQLALIRALRGSGRTLVLIGEAAPGCAAYEEACRAAADGNVHFLGRLNHGDPLLASAYSAAACFALTSWYETPGLAALEAAATGTPLVLPAAGAGPEYFGPWARYVAPHDLTGILRAVVAATAGGRDPALADAVLNQFTWRHAAEITLEAYGHVA